MLQFLHAAQRTMSNTASSYAVSSLVSGMFLAGLSVMLALCAVKKPWLPTFSGLFFTLVTLLYGIMMFASSYVEEEQHFWYWITCAWTLCLYARAYVQLQSYSHCIHIRTHRLSIPCTAFELKQLTGPQCPHFHIPSRSCHIRSTPACLSPLAHTLEPNRSETRRRPGHRTHLLLRPSHPAVDPGPGDLPPSHRQTHPPYLYQHHAAGTRGELRNRYGVAGRGLQVELHIRRCA